MKNVSHLEKPFMLKPCSKKELSHLFQISPLLLRSWLKAIQPDLGEPVGGLFSVNQVEFMIGAYGIPGKIVNEVV